MRILNQFTNANSLRRIHVLRKNLQQTWKVELKCASGFHKTRNLELLMVRAKKGMEQWFDASLLLTVIQL